MKHYYCLFILSFLFLCLCAVGKHLSENNVHEQCSLYSAEVDSLILSSVEHSDIPGAVLCVVADTKIQYLQAYGNRQVFPDTLPMTLNTQFDLASLSKCVGTGLSILTLLDKNILQLSDPIDLYLPNYVSFVGDADSVSRPQTIVDFLTHTSGMPAYASYTTLLHDNPTASLGQRKALLLLYMGSCPRLSEPGTEFRYSCLNFITLQYLIEQLTGMPLDEYAKEHVFRPLGMEHTGYYPLDSFSEKGFSHWPSHDGLVVAPTEKIAPFDSSALVPPILSVFPLLSVLPCDSLPVCYEAIVHDPLAREINAGVSGNAGVFSTAEDLAKMIIWMLNPDSIEGPVSSSALSLMFSIPQGYEEFGRYLAWDKSSAYASCKGDFTSDHVACHTGYTGTSIVIDFEKRVAVILLTNRAHPSDGGAVSSLRKAVSNAVFSKFQ